MDTKKHEELNGSEIVLVQNVVHRSRGCHELLLLRVSYES
jgi:hypothetical protein